MVRSSGQPELQREILFRIKPHLVRRVCGEGGYAVGSQEFGDFLDVQGPAEIVALHLVATMGAQECQLALGLDAFCDDAEI